LGAAFFVPMVKHIENIYYLNREEVVEYLTAAYPILWCFTRWSGDAISVNIALKSGTKKSIKVTPYKIKGEKHIQISKQELDKEILLVT
jgi:hypothetical protein